MKASRFTDAEIAFIIRQGEDGTPVAEACRDAGISQATYFNWKKKYEGMMPSDMKRMRELEQGNVRLKRIVADRFLSHCPPNHIRSDNGPEFIEKALRAWLGRLGVKTLYIEPGSPWENGCCVSFNSKLRDELLARDIFYMMKEAKMLIEWWRLYFNTFRPHSSLGYESPAPKAVLPRPFMPPYVQGVAA